MMEFKYSQIIAVIIPYREDLLKQMNATLKFMYDDGTVDKINSTYLD